MIGKHIGIDLLRHGDTGQRSYRGQLDDSLSALGWSQLRAAIFGRSWDAIVSSPLRRCAEFAQELAGARRVPLRIDPRLAEYHFGEWQGVPIETLAQEQSEALTQFWMDPVAHPPPGGEPFAAFRERLSRALDEVAEEQLSLFAPISAVATGAADAAFDGEDLDDDDGDDGGIELSLAPPPPVAGAGGAGGASGAGGAAGRISACP